MPIPHPGEVWIVDLGLTAKVRPCLVITDVPGANDLNVCSVVAHTTSLRGNGWEVALTKPFLSNQGAFDVQRIATVPVVKLERKLGTLTPAELNTVLDRLAKRFGIKQAQ